MASDVDCARALGISAWIQDTVGNGVLLWLSCEFFKQKVF